MKYFIPLIIILLSNSIFAQQKDFNKLSHYKLSNSQLISLIKNRPNLTSNKGILYENINFAWTMNAISNYAGTVSMAYLWPDSTMLVLNQDSSISHTFYHSIGEFINPNSNYFNLYHSDNSSKSVYLDHIGMYSIYKRNPSLTNIVDTIIVQVRLGNSEDYYWYDPLFFQQNYNTDSLLFKGIYHDGCLPTSSNNNYYTFKYLLDTSSVDIAIAGGINYFEIPINLFLSTLTTNHNIYPMFAVTFSFKPGTTWNPNVDTIQNYNRLKFLSYEEKGIGTFPTYTKQDWNCSYVWTAQAFNTNVPIENDTLFAPSYAYLAEFPMEHHYIDYVLRLEGQFTDIESSNSLLNSIEVFPNPVSKNINFNFSISRNAEINISIYDLSGKIVINKDIKLTELNNTIKINVEELSFGAYIYRISSDKQIKTGKFIVIMP